jgi:RNA recognition motif-containing protein
MARIFVGNLSYTATEADLRAAFEPYGRVSSVRISLDSRTGESQGFAFIEMPLRTQAYKAEMALHGKKFEGHRLYVRVIIQ